MSHIKRYFGKRKESYYEKRFLFHHIGDVESISGSYVSLDGSDSKAFETDYEGTYVSTTNYTASKDFSNQTFIKTNDFLGIRPLGTTLELKPSTKINFGGGKFLDETFVYPANHLFVVGSSKDSIEDLTYKGTQNAGGDVIESQAFNDLSTDAFYHILTTGGSAYTVTYEN